MPPAADPSFPAVTRLAPSPTGALHLGNARTFLWNWALARSRGWRIVLRIDDLDGPRIKAGADAGAIDDLRWLGLDWDDGPYYQRAELSPYTAALDSLRARGLAYPCVCTRKEIEQAQSAPHAEDHEVRYPGTCRHRAISAQASSAQTSEPAAWRLIVPDDPVVFDDMIQGRQVVNVQAQVGDFVIATKAGLPAYQLAAVVDDARQGVTDVVRGDDLIGSTGRQIWLYRLLGLGSPPRHWHLPLVLGPDGRRLAKRHGDTRLAWYRDQCVAAERVVGLLAFWAGLSAERTPCPARDFAQAFDPARLPPGPIVFTPEDHAWLLQR
ncbi:MAG: tRNA glutamyl-Q(34) synthetase GluQRS [Planctomycetota bacterium]|nr:tRNA glutamyl-Q(34) synthetase GluQRS [Planctomycetota bacterium]